MTVTFKPVSTNSFTMSDLTLLLENVIMKDIVRQ